MTFTMASLIDSLAGVLKSRYPDYPRYYSPNQQGTKPPCFFIFTMPSTVDMEAGGSFARDIGIDIVFVQQRNIANGHQEILEVQDFLDESLAVFPYSDGAGTAYMNTYEARASIEDGELHYQFHVKERVRAGDGHAPMQEMEDVNARIKE